MSGTAEKTISSVTAIFIVVAGLAFLAFGPREAAEADDPCVVIEQMEPTELSVLVQYLIEANEQGEDMTAIYGAGVPA